MTDTAPVAVPRWRVRRVTSTGSTNTDLLAAAAAGEPAGAVLVADAQTAGLGRLGRRWLTPPGSALAVSVLLRPRRVDGWLPLVVGLAVRDAVVALAPGLTVALKWPNDVLAAAGGDDPGKVGGILVQLGGGGAAVVGIGVNVTVPPAALPPGVGATSLSALGHPVDRAELLHGLLDRLGRRLDAWSVGEPAAADYREHCSTLGRRVRVAVAGGEVAGRASGLDAAGRLVVDTASGPVAVDAGDVTHVRPD